MVKVFVPACFLAVVIVGGGDRPGARDGVPYNEMLLPFRGLRPQEDPLCVLGLVAHGIARMPLGGGGNAHPFSAILLYA